MPGIVGLLTRDPDSRNAERQLRAMLGCMLHEAFYTHGTFTRPELGWYLGWVNHPGSFSDCNPVINATGDRTLIFSGEHLAHHESSIERDSQTARSLLRLYEAKGDAFLLELNGWFAGVLVDLREQRLLLFNDRFGLHRVYCHESPESFAFASEAKALLSIRPDCRRLDRRGLGEFLGFGAVLQNRTLFSGVSVLPGGSAWSVGRTVGITKRRYFDPATWEQQPVLGEDAFYEKLRATICKILPAYFRSDTSVGVSLTGGLDTRLVMAGLADAASPAACYTYGGTYRDCYDVRVAREIAAAYGQRHHLISLDEEFFADFPALAEKTVWVTDGCLDICAAHEVYLSRRARDLALIRLTGNYGSEIIRDVTTFKYGAPPETLFDPDVSAAMRTGAACFAESRASHGVTFSAFQDIPWHLYGRLAAAESQFTVRSPYMDNDVVAVMYQAPPRLRQTNDIMLRLITDLSPALSQIRTDMGYGGNGTRAAAVIRQAYRYLLFKAEWYYAGGTPHWVSRIDHNPLARRLERVFLGSHKIEHYRVWFRDQLFDYVQGMLGDRRTASRPYLNRHSYHGLVVEHQQRRGNHMDAISKLITLELVHRLLIEADYRGPSRLRPGREAAAVHRAE